MATGINGWPVLFDAPDATIEGFITGRIRPGDVDVVFTYLCEQLNKIEKNVQAWCWGWAVRPVRGQTSGYSNHAPGTALDWNAPAHPLGVRGTWSEKEIDYIDAVLRELRGIVFWGEHYQNRKDGMHFEIVGSSREVALVAQMIRNNQLKGQQPDWKPKSAKAVHFGRLQEQFLIAAGAQKGKNARNNGVGLVQEALNRLLNVDLVVDGVCGEATLNAWGRWEDKHGGHGRRRVPDRKSVEALEKKAKLDMTGKSWDDE